MRGIFRLDNFNGYVNDEYRHNKRDDGGLENARGDDYGARLIIHLRGDRVDDVHHGFWDICADEYHVAKPKTAVIAIIASV